MQDFVWQEDVVAWRVGVFLNFESDNGRKSPDTHVAIRILHLKQLIRNLSHEIRQDIFFKISGAQGT